MIFFNDKHGRGRRRGRKIEAEVNKVRIGMKGQTVGEWKREGKEERVRGKERIRNGGVKQRETKNRDNRRSTDKR